MNKNHLYLLSLILFGAIIRIWNFWGDCFHCDELFTYNLAQKGIPDILAYTLNNDCNPPLFYLIDHFSLLVFGLNSFATRFPSIVFGILLIPAVYYLGKEIDGELTGLLSATIITTLGSMWYYSQFARSYMLLCLLITILCIYWIRISRGNNEVYTWITFSIVSAVSIWTHLFALIPVSLMLLYLLSKYRTTALKWCLASVLLCLPLLGLGYQIILGRGVGTNQVDHWPTIWELIYTSPLEFWGYGFVFILGLVIYSQYKKPTPLIIGACLVFGAELLLSKITPVFPRYSLFLVPILCVVAMIPVSQFLTNEDATKGQRYFVFLFVTSFYYATIIFQFTTVYFLPKGQFCI